LLWQYQHQVEAFDTGLLQHGKDIIVVNKDRQIAEAKKHALLMAKQVIPTHSQN
jgi:hypothetical protein